MEATVREMDGGVAAAAGFVAAGVACGIKRDGRLDLALLHCPGGAVAAGVFTRNEVVAAPVVLARGRVPARDVRAVVINSGCANACTGGAGMAAAEAVVAAVATALGCAPEQVLPASTGVIGDPLPVKRLTAGLPAVVAGLGASGATAFADAILTTDTRRKEAAVEVELAGGRVRIGGCCKGSGMIHPNMATMLAVVTTDAQLDPATCQTLLSTVVATTFNRISVDADTSTNDTLYLLASGSSGVAVSGEEDLVRLAAGLARVCGSLALQIVADGEGATKLATVQVTGGRDGLQVERVAAAICRSPLVKTALFGQDANWGRIVAAAGAVGAGITPETTRLWLDDLLLFAEGVGTGAGRSPAAAAAMHAHDLTLRLDLGQGEACATYWTCDLSFDYVRINAEYRT